MENNLYNPLSFKSRYMEITPGTKVGELLETYPGLEDVLISLSPSFSKLKNPLLRKTIARVATLQQIALVGGVPLETIINSLRNETGQHTLSIPMESKKQLNSAQPEWLKVEKIFETLDAREMLQRGEHPLAEVLSKTSKMEAGSIYELVTSFLPAPLISKVEAAGLISFSIESQPSEFRNYFYKPL